MDYYRQHREQRLSYQKAYNKQSENYKTYQQEYYQLNKKRLYKEHRIRLERKKKRKPLPKYKIELLEQMLRQKLQDYKDTLYQENVRSQLNPTCHLSSDYKIKQNKFILSFD